MKTYFKVALFATVFAVFFFSCTKTEGLSSNTNTTLPLVPGSIISSGDTIFVTSSNVDFRITKTSPCYPSNEIFFDSITSTKFGSNAEYKWDFGNGDKATGKWVSHKYQYRGVFTITLSVYENNVLKQQITTTVKPEGQYVTPVASFGSKLNNYQDPNWVAFNAQSSITEGNIVSYEWNWKDGTKSTVATAYTEHRFPEIEKDSIYEVELIVTSHAGCTDTVVNNVYIPRSYLNVGKISMTEIKPRCLPDSQIIRFYQDTTGLPANTIYEWDLGEGIRYFGNPIDHHFIYSKTYPVVCYIKIIKPDGTNLKTVVRNTSVFGWGSDINPIPYINKRTFLNAPTNTYVQLDGWGKVGDGQTIIKLKWEFGDGNIDSSNTPYAYNQYLPPYPIDDKYIVRLTVTASSGCVGTDTFPVFIR